VRLSRIDTRPLHIDAGEILCVACVRNESLRLPYFLDYHRDLGVDRFLVTDNDSDDGTTEYLLGQPDVHVFLTRERYSESGFGVSWIASLLELHAMGHWALTVDVDELLVFPDSETVGLGRLAAYLEGRGEEALLTFLLDMYSDRAIRDTAYERGAPFLTACAWFDRDTYRWEGSRDGFGRVPTRGGPRERLFWGERDRSSRSPFLPKIPYVRWRPGLSYVRSTHLLPGAVLSDMTGALLHFKLFSDFSDRTQVEVGRREHWDNAGQYEAYREVLAAHPDLSAFHDGSVRYGGSAQLVAIGLLNRPDDF
jgi:hypothetical protein